MLNNQGVVLIFISVISVNSCLGLVSTLPRPQIWCLTLTFSPVFIFSEQGASLLQKQSRRTTSGGNQIAGGEKGATEKEQRSAEVSRARVRDIPTRRKKERKDGEDNLGRLRVKNPRVGPEPYMAWWHIEAEGTQTSGEKGGKVRKTSEGEREGLRYTRHSTELCLRAEKEGLLWVAEVTPPFWVFSLIREQSKENLRKMEEENDNLKSQVNQYSIQLDTSLSKQNSTQQVNEELTNKVSTQKPQRGEKFEPCDP